MRGRGGDFPALFFQRGATRSRLPPRSAMDGRHWRPSPPFEMRYIEQSSPSRYGKTPSCTNYHNGRGVSERQWRSAANRSPLPLRSVLDAPHWGAGPEPAGETGVGTAGLKTPPSHACGVTPPSVRGERAPVALWCEPTEPAGETLPPPLGEVARRSRVGRGKRGRVYSFGPLLRQARVVTRPALDFPLGNE